jgi:hypothetical protein
VAENLVSAEVPRRVLYRVEEAVMAETTGAVGVAYAVALIAGSGSAQLTVTYPVA